MDPAKIPKNCLFLRLIPHARIKSQETSLVKAHDLEFWKKSKDFILKLSGHASQLTWEERSCEKQNLQKIDTTTIDSNITDDSQKFLFFCCVICLKEKKYENIYSS